MGGRRSRCAGLLLIVLLSGLAFCQGALRPSPQHAAISASAKRPSPAPGKQKRSPPPLSPPLKNRSPPLSPPHKASVAGAHVEAKPSTLVGNNAVVPLRKAEAVPVTAPTTPPRSPTSAGWTGKWLPDQAKMFYLHNWARTRHGAAPLQWDDTLAAQCQAWINQCIWSHSDSQLRPNIGENIYFSYGAKFPAATAGASAVEAWYREKERMNWAQPELTAAEDKIVGHFTAMVWRATQRMGCAWNSCKTLKNLEYNGSLPINLVACHYTPAGNWLGNFTQNVLPEGSSTTTVPKQPAAATSPASVPAPVAAPTSPQTTISTTPPPMSSSVAPQPTYSYYPNEQPGYYETPAQTYGQPFYFFGRRK